MDAAEIISEVTRLPLAEQKQVLEKIGENIKQIEVSEEERLEQLVLERLLAKGIISEIAAPMTDDEDDEVEPIEIEGEPLSEMIIRERR